MRIKYRTLSAGPDGVRQADSVHDVPSDHADTLIKAGYAVAVGETPATPTIPPTTTLPEAETAALSPTGKPVGERKPPARAGK